MSLLPIVCAVGGEVYAGGRRASIPGPGHSHADRSVSLLLEDGRLIVHSFAGDDWRDVLAWLRDQGLVDAAGRPVGGVGGVRLDGSPELPRRQRIQRARALWDEGHPIAGSLSARHCRRRAIAGALPDALRHHPGVPSAVYLGRGVVRPALLAAIRDSVGDLCAVELTYLAADADRARARTPRKTVGVVPPGAAVRLATPGPRMLVGEGVFTTLAAAARFGLPAWALLSARNLQAWRPPPGVAGVVIAADRGRVGEAAARGLARDLAGAGVAVEVRWPPAAFEDWNAAAVAAREEEEGRVGAGVADGWSGPPAWRCPYDPCR